MFGAKYRKYSLLNPRGGSRNLFTALSYDRKILFYHSQFSIYIWDFAASEAINASHSESYWSGQGVALGEQEISARTHPYYF